MIAPELDSNNDGFLIRLSFLVYLLFERLVNDIAEHSPIIKGQVDASRFLVSQQIPELNFYRDFISHLNPA